MNRKVVVGSLNPVKLNAIKQAFASMFKKEQFNIEGVSVPSDVPDQPMDSTTTLEGAMNRADNAMATVHDADFWVGIEGGIEKTAEREMQAFAWIVIKTKEQIGKGKTATFFLPYEVIRLIEEGKELGEADDIVFGQDNSKVKNGAVGILTQDAITRTDLYSHAAIIALIPFKQDHHYNEISSSAKNQTRSL